MILLLPPAPLLVLMTVSCLLCVSPVIHLHTCPASVLINSSSSSSSVMFNSSLHVALPPSAGIKSLLQHPVCQVLTSAQFFEDTWISLSTTEVLGPLRKRTSEKKVRIMT